MNKNYISGIFLSACLAWTVGITALAAPGTTGTWRQEQDGRWYYYDEKGTMCTGWIQVEGRYYYLYEDGHCAVSEITPDGYRVDASGAWYEEKLEILGQEFPLPSKFQDMGTIGEGWGSAEAALNGIAKKVTNDFGGKRKLSVGSQAIEYKTADTSGKEGSWYLGLYKDFTTGGYRLDIHILLDRDAGTQSRTEAVDYGILKAMLTSVSSAPEQLEDAIYSSWQEENIWGISRTALIPVGDCGIRYEAGEGYGRYYLQPLP